MIQDISDNPFPELPYEVSTIVFGHLDPTLTPTLSLVSKTWKSFVEKNRILLRTWKFDYTFVGWSGGLCYGVGIRDYTGLSSIESVTVNSIEKKRIPEMVVKIKNHWLRTGRKYLQPGYDSLTEKNFLYFKNSLSFIIRRLDSDIIKISEYAISDKTSRCYVDTSFEYRTKDKTYYFVYDFWPHITDPNAHNRMEKFLAKHSPPQYRCFQNKFGIIIEELVNPNKIRLYYAKPKDKKFKKINRVSNLDWLISSHASQSAKETNEYVLHYMKENHHDLYKMSRKKKCVKSSRSKKIFFRKKPTKTQSKEWLLSNLKCFDPPQGYYGSTELRNTIILVNYDSPTGEIIPYLNGEPAKTIKQTDGFTLTYPTREMDF
ncbi:MAG: hypothetical protein K940chlam3_01191 [Chlamydiae bacterium]|nr:hypothetical protein [Chlamydiota bacterium]